MNRAAADTVASSGGGPAGPPRVPPINGETLALLGAGALILLRLCYLGFPDLFPEEAYYWNYAKHLDYGYLDHPPMVAWLIALGTRLFGDREFGVRIFAFVSSLASTFFVYRLTALLYSHRVAAWAALLMQALPIYFLTGFIMTPDAPLTACWAATLYFLARVFFERRSPAWWSVGVSFGLGMLTKYTIALLGPAALLFILWDRESRFWLRRVAPYGAALLALVLFSPVILWNQAHHWASFAYQSANRIQEPRRFSLHELIGAVLALLTPLGAFAAGQALAGRATDRPPRGFELPGTTDEEGRERRRLLFVRVFTFVPLSVFVAFSLVHRVKLNWTGPLWLAVLPSIAALVTAAFADQGQPFLRRGWQATLAFCAVFYLGVLQHLSFGIPGVPYADNVDLLPAGWSEMGRQIEAQAAALQQATPANIPVRIVGMDRNFIASEMAFYHSHPAEAALSVTGAHLFDQNSLMYSYWFPAKAEDGDTLLLVGFVRAGLQRLSIANHGHPSGQIEPHWLTCRGRKVRRYFTLVVNDYQSGGVSP